MTGDVTGNESNSEPPACDLGNSAVNQHNPNCAEDEGDEEPTAGAAAEPPACDLDNDAVEEHNPNCENEETGTDTGTDTGTETDTGTDTDTDSETGSTPASDVAGGPTAGSATTSETPSAPRGPARRLYCLDGRMIDLPVWQEVNGAVPARFYAGIGASCDVLSGYVATGLWVDGTGTIWIATDLVDLGWVVAYPFYVKA